jgi:hypothetical protein
MTVNRIASLFALGLILAGCAPVTIDSVPSGATVYDADGDRVGTTPYATNVVINSRAFTVRKDRYFEQNVTIGPDSAETVKVTLNPQPVILYSKPVAEIIDADEKQIGKTPTQIPVGKTAAEYTLKADKYYDQTVSLSVDSDQPTIVELARRPIVNLTADPAGAAIYENGKKIGTAPVEQEITSARTFEVRKDGYFTKSVTIKDAPPYTVHTELEAFPEITVQATPSGADIYHDGKKAGTGRASFSVGEPLKVEVRADRYYSETATLTPESGKTVRVELKAKPYVTIDSTPSGAVVKADGKTIGDTPVETLIESTTTVSVSKDGYQTATETLTGKDERVTVELEKVPEPEPVVTQQVKEAESKKTQTKEAQAEEKPAEEKPAEKKSFWQRLFGK